MMNIPNICLEECKCEEKAERKAEGKKKCVKEIIIISDSDEIDESDDESIEFQSITLKSYYIILLIKYFYTTKHRSNLFTAYNQVVVNGMHFTHLNPTE